MHFHEREHLARLPDPRAAGGLLLVEAICAHYTAHDIEVEEGACVLVAEDSFELEGEGGRGTYLGIHRQDAKGAKVN
jgi:hypothetical protein